MKAVEVKDKKSQKKFLDFRRKIYRDNPVFVDNNLFMIKEVFAKKTSFTDNKEIFVYNIEDNNDVLCQGIIVYTKCLPDYIQLCFFESLPNVENAVKILVDKAVELGMIYGCERLVIGLNGHVNYGLGFLNSDYDTKNSFSSSANPQYYNDYFKALNCDEINLNTYRIDKIDNRLDRYGGIINKINKNYTFKCFDKKQFDYYSKIYTDLNNICFDKHRYYYKRNYKEDKEMLKELFLFMKEDSLIFAFDGDKPVAFIMWYPDFNELADCGEAFGAKHFIKNIFMNKKIHTAKIMEFGVLSEYRTIGMPVALINQIFLKLGRYGVTKVDTSWVLEENKDSNSVCSAICDGLYKRFIVYEKRLK